MAVLVLLIWNTIRLMVDSKELVKVLGTDLGMPFASNVTATTITVDEIATHGLVWLVKRRL